MFFMPLGFWGNLRSSSLLLLILSLGNFSASAQVAPRIDSLDDYKLDDIQERFRSVSSRLDQLERLLEDFDSAPSTVAPPASTAPSLAEPVPVVPRETPRTNPIPKNVSPPAPADSASPVLLSYPVRPLAISYGGNALGLPDLSPVFSAIVPIEGRAFPLENLTTVEGDIVSLTSDDLFRISEVVLLFLKDQGFEGIVAFPDPNQVDPLNGNDRRPPGSTRLDLKVWVSRTQSIDFDYSTFGEADSSHSTRIRKSLDKWSLKNRVLGSPLRASFVRVVDRLGDHPTRSSRLLLSPAEQAGEINALVRLKDERRASTGLNASNTGTKSTGEWLLGGYARFYQPTGADDEIGLNWSASNTFERYAFGLGYERPLVFPDVLDLGLNLSYSRYDASTFAINRIGFDFEGSTFSTDLNLNLKPLGWEGPNWQFETFAGLRYDGVSTSNSFNPSKGKGSFASPRLGLSLKKKGGVVRSLSSIVLSGNLSGISEDRRLLLGGINAEERVLQLAVSHLGNLDLGKLFGSGGSASRHLLFFRLDGKWGLRNVRLMPQRQFILGGLSTIRGYPEAMVAGDHGFLLSLEYRWKLFQLGASDSSKRFSISMGPFLDYGQTYVNDPFPDFESDRSLLGAGIGLRFELPFGGYARLDFAKPLKEVVNVANGSIMDGTRSKDARVHAVISMDY